MTLQEQFDAKRQQYMDCEITHEAFYLWLADEIGVKVSDLPVTLDRVRKSNDPHLNDIPLKLWDKMDYFILTKARYAGMKSWSLGNTVCVLKAVARREAARAVTL